MQRSLTVLVGLCLAVHLASSASLDIAEREKVDELYIDKRDADDASLDVEKRGDAKKPYANPGWEHPNHATYFKERFPTFTEEGVPCVFPFTYKGKQYTECVQGSGKTWCAIIDPDYDTAGEWGYCVTPVELRPVVTAKGVPCKIPFTYKGVEYTECIPECATCRRKWCYTDDKGSYDYCMVWRKPSVNLNTWYMPEMPTPGEECAKKTKPTSLTAADKKYLVDEHNKMRAEEPATFMRKMEWNEYMASRAQYFAEQCPTGHGEKDNCWKVKPWAEDFGQNLIVGYALYSHAGTNVQDMFKEWGPNEKKDYTLEGNKCGNVCGHYTQVVWPESYLLGCGVANCTVPGDEYPYRTIAVCNYWPQGNTNGAAPYTKGVKGSGCSEAAWPHDYLVDSDGFCNPCPDGSRKCSKQKELCKDVNPHTCKGAAIQWCEMKDYLIQTWTLFNDYLHNCKKTCGLCDMPPEYSRQENL